MFLPATTVVTFFPHVKQVFDRIPAPQRNRENKDLASRNTQRCMFAIPLLSQHQPESTFQILRVRHILPIGR